MDEAKEKAEDERTPFERMKDFAKKIVRVRKTEVPKHKPRKRAEGNRL